MGEITRGRSIRRGATARGIGDLTLSKDDEGGGDGSGASGGGRGARCSCREPAPNRRRNSAIRLASELTIVFFAFSRDFFRRMAKSLRGEGLTTILGLWVMQSWVARATLLGISVAPSISSLICPRDRLRRIDLSLRTATLSAMSSKAAHSPSPSLDVGDLTLRRCASSRARMR